MFATFALGTALGDFTATSLNLGLPGLGHPLRRRHPDPGRWRAGSFGLNGIAAFWMSYVVTRPLGASFADYISKPRSLSGIAFGDGPTALVFAVAVFVLVAYLALARPDVQEPLGEHAHWRRDCPLRAFTTTLSPSSKRSSALADGLAVSTA